MKHNKAMFSVAATSKPLVPYATAQPSSAMAPERGGRPKAFDRCRERPRRRLAAALLCCAAQAGLLQATAAAAQASELAAAQQVQQVQEPGVNINTASAEELAAGLSGIGESKALAIVRYREQFGDFESIEELAEVSGIGVATVERNRALLRLR